MQSGDCFSYRNAGSEFPGFPNQCGESYSDRQALRRASPAFPNCPNQCGESPHAPPNSGRVSFASPNFAANCAQNKNSTALTIGNEGIQIQWPSRAHTRKHEAALPPVLMFFYNFFINIILFYYWVTNRDFIDLFCHTPKT